jgi:hypothetical protein
MIRFTVIADETDDGLEFQTEYRGCSEAEATKLAAELLRDADEDGTTAVRIHDGRGRCVFEQMIVASPVMLS